MSFGKYLKLNDESIDRGDPKYIVSIDDTSLKRQTLLCSDNCGNKEGNVRNACIVYYTDLNRQFILFLILSMHLFQMLA